MQRSNKFYFILAILMAFFIAVGILIPTVFLTNNNLTSNSISQSFNTNKSQASKSQQNNNLISAKQLPFNPINIIPNHEGDDITITDTLEYSTQTKDGKTKATYPTFFIGVIDHTNPKLTGVYFSSDVRTVPFQSFIKSVILLSKITFYNPHCNSIFYAVFYAQDSNKTWHELIQYGNLKPYREAVTGIPDHATFTGIGTLRNVVKPDKSYNNDIYISTNVGLYLSDQSVSDIGTKFTLVSTSFNNTRCQLWTDKNKYWGTMLLEVDQPDKSKRYYLIVMGYFYDLTENSGFNPTYVKPYVSDNGTFFIGTNDGIYQANSSEHYVWRISGTKGLQIKSLSVKTSSASTPHTQIITSATNSKNNTTQTYYMYTSTQSSYVLKQLNTINSEMTTVFWTHDSLNNNTSAYIGTTTGLYQFKFNKFKTQFIKGIGQDKILTISAINTTVPHFFVSTAAGTLYYSNQLQYNATFLKDQTVNTPVCNSFISTFNQAHDMFLISPTKFYGSANMLDIFSWINKQTEDKESIQPYKFNFNWANQPVFFFSSNSIKIKNYNIVASIPILTSTIINYSYNGGPQVSPSGTNLTFRSDIKKYSYQKDQNPYLGINKITLTVKTPYNDIKSNSNSIQLVCYAWLTSASQLDDIRFSVPDSTKTLVNSPYIVGNSDAGDAKNAQLVITDSNQLTLNFQDVNNPIIYKSSGYYKGTFDKNFIFSNTTNMVSFKNKSGGESLTLSAGIYRLYLVFSNLTSINLYLEVGTDNQVIPYIDKMKINNPWTDVYALAAKINIKVDIGRWIEPSTANENSNSITIDTINKLLTQTIADYQKEIDNTWFKTWNVSDNPPSISPKFIPPDTKKYLGFASETKLNNSDLDALIASGQTALIKKLKQDQFPGIYGALNYSLKAQINRNIYSIVDLATQYHLDTSANLVTNIEIFNRDSETVAQKCADFKKFVADYKYEYQYSSQYGLIKREKEEAKNIPGWLNFDSYQFSLKKPFSFVPKQIYLSNYLWSPENNDPEQAVHDSFQSATFEKDYKSEVLAQFAKENNGYNIYQALAKIAAGSAKDFNKLDIDPAIIDTPNKFYKLMSDWTLFNNDVLKNLKTEAMAFAQNSKYLKQWTLGYGTNFKFSFDAGAINYNCVNSTKYDPNIFINPDVIDIISQHAINQSALQTQVIALYEQEFFKFYDKTPNQLLQQDISNAQDPEQHSNLKTALHGYTVQDVIDYYGAVSPQNKSQVDTNYNNTGQNYTQWLTNHANLYWTRKLNAVVNQANSWNISINPIDEPTTKTQLEQLNIDTINYKLAITTELNNDINGIIKTMSNWNLGFDFNFDSSAIFANVKEYIANTTWKYQKFNPTSAAKNAINFAKLKTDVTTQYIQQFKVSHNNSTPTQYLASETNDVISHVNLYGNKLNDILNYYHVSLPKNRNDLENNFHNTNESFQIWLKNASYNYNNIIPHHTKSSNKSDLVWIIPVAAAIIIILAISFIIWSKFFKLKMQQKTKTVPKHKNSKPLKK